MGETHSVSFTSEAASAPDAPDYTVTSESEHGVSVGMEPQLPDEGTPEPRLPQEPERPEWLDEKFATPEDMAKAYRELQSRMGAQDAPEATEVAEVAEAAGVTTAALEPFAEEYYSTGELSDDAFTQLEGMGLSRELVTAFMEGQQAVQAAELGKIYEQAGGQEAYSQALAWAAQTMSVEEIRAYNDQVEAGDLAAAGVAVRGLMAMFYQSNGGDREATLLPTEPTGSGGNAPYQSVAQVMVDMKNPAYKNDPAFRAQVAKRLESSNIM
jgi:hypothetical protein